MLIAYFEDATSPTYGATDDRPIISLMDVMDIATADLNTEVGFMYIEITDLVQTDDYKISWNGTDFEMVERDELSTVATWSATTIDADGVDSAVLGSGLPNPTTVSLTYQAYEALAPVSGDVTTGTLTITADLAGEYEVSINVFPYKPYSQTITAT
jgi:hypothetical protein